MIRQPSQPNAAPLASFVVMIVWYFSGYALAAAETATAAGLSTIEGQVAAIPTKESSQRVKRAVLELALERARNAQASNLPEEARELVTDVEIALAGPADSFAARNPAAAHLGILKPLLTGDDNPYLRAMVEKAGNTLKKPDLEWPRATVGVPVFSGLGGPHGLRSTAIEMREYFWLFAHQESPMRGHPELLKRALRRAHAFIDAHNLENPRQESGPEVFDQFAVEEALSGLYEIIELHPGLLLPNERRVWDRALRKASASLWNQMRNAQAWNLNIETARMVGVLNMGYYTDNEEMIAKVMSHTDAVLGRMRPDGGWPYHGEGNPSVNYHNALLGSLVRIYEQTGHKPIAKALVASQWKGPVTGRTDEFWTSPFFKAYRWNITKGTEAGPEAVAALSGNPYLRWLRDRDIRPDRNQVAWYRGEIKPRPLPEEYTIPDRNVLGPRAWYGRFCYAGNLADPKRVAGHETLMGAMTVDEKDGRINSILADVTPRIRTAREDEMDAKRGAVASSAWASLTDRLVGATTITRNYSVSTGLHGIAGVRFGAYQGKVSGWRGRQIWIGLPDRILGLVSVVPGEDGAEAHAVNGILRLISGGSAGAETTKEIERISDTCFRYGELDILVHDSSYKSLSVAKKKYRTGRYPATEITFSNRGHEPAPFREATRFPADTDLRFVVEIRPIWTNSRIKVKALAEQDLLGLQMIGEERALQVWLNVSTQERECAMKRDLLPEGQASFTLSDGVLRRSPFASEVPLRLNLKGGQHSVLVVSPDPFDHQPGWSSYSQMIREMSKGCD